MVISKDILIAFFLMVTAVFASFSQAGFNMPRSDSDKIKFRLINNLIVIPVEINGVELSFILDSGVSKPILFNITNTDSLQIKNVETIYLRGLGEGSQPIEALRSRRNFFKIGNAVNVNQDIYVVFDSSMNFSNRLGVNVHGIIGYDVFKNFTVEINYVTKVLKLHKPEKFKQKKCKKCEEFDLTFFNNKPYIDTEVMIDSTYTTTRLLIDTGSSDALWLFEDSELGLEPYNETYFNDFLGKGLSGNVYGKRSKVQVFKLKSFELENVNVAFPDSSSLGTARRIRKRNGSVSGEILKRFNVIFDYNNAKITLKKNSNYRQPFYYNRSGIIIEHTGSRVVKEKEDRGRIGYGNATNSTRIELQTHYQYALKPAYSIVEIRPGSPAELVGLEVDDVLLSINGKQTHEITLQRIMGYFKNDIGKLIRLKVDREGELMSFEFRLEDVFKQKKLSN